MLGQELLQPLLRRAAVPDGRPSGTIARHSLPSIVVTAPPRYRVRHHSQPQHSAQAFHDDGDGDNDDGSVVSKGTTSNTMDYDGHDHENRDPRSSCIVSVHLVSASVL